MNSIPDRSKVRAEVKAAFAELAARIREHRPELAVSTAGIEPLSSMGTEVSEAIADARRKAAVLGWFEPQRLIKGAKRGFRERVLSELVADCDLAPRDLARRARHGVWRLRRERRRQVLAELATDAGTRAQLLRETEPEAKDRESRAFRQVLRGKSLHPGRARMEDRPAILQAAEWTNGIFPNAPNPAEVRGLLARDAIQESLQVLLPSFRGRRPELRTLRRFVFGPPPVDGRPPIFGLSGIGGAGKSTLLARFAMELLERSPRPGVVLIDYDRARFASGDPVALTFELTRQIGAWFPAITTALQELRRDARQNLLSSGFASSDQMNVSLEAVVRSISEVNYGLGGILANAKIGVGGGRPLIVIMDTFEVLQGGRGEGSTGFGIRGVHAVARWAEELFLDCELHELKVVVAGRAPIAEDPVFHERLTEPELRLTGIDEASALALLRDLELNAKEARAVVDAVGEPADGSSNPMILRLVARLVKAGTLRPDNLAEETGIGREALDQELVQAMLYRRILKHIGDREEDKALAAIAHPGLVLRRVTPNLIERVLFPLLDVKQRGPARARELFDRLRREVWLVRQSDRDTVVHRTDLRRIMLRLIDADMRRKARQIHRATAKYLRRGPRREPQRQVGRGRGLLSPIDAHERAAGGGHRQG